MLKPTVSTWSTRQVTAHCCPGEPALAAAAHTLHCVCRFYLYFERPSDGFNFVVMNNLLPNPKLHTLLRDRLVEETELGTWAWKAMKATRTPMAVCG